MKKLNPLFVEHYDEYYIVYKHFSAVKPEQSIFYIKGKDLTLIKLSLCYLGILSTEMYLLKKKNVFSGLKCKSFFGPHVDHVYNFNPMMEFINNYGKHVDFAFEEFKRQYNRSYVIGTAENFKRKNKFRQNLRWAFVIRIYINI